MQFFSYALSFFCIFSALAAKNNEGQCKYNLAVCAIFQNEAPYLKEWIEYHRMQGVEHFYLFDNQSADKFKAVLKPYIRKGIVEVSYWPYLPGSTDMVPAQNAAYNACLEEARGKARWIAFIDIDEFLVPNEHTTLAECLKEYESYGAVHVRWIPFGTSHVEKIPQSALLLETLTMKMKFTPGQKLLGKNIVKPRLAKQVGVHYVKLKSGYSLLDINPGGWIEKPSLQLNHYWTRDISFLLNVKRPRREMHEGAKWSQEYVQQAIGMYNDVEDDSVIRFIPELRQRVFGL